MRRWEGSGFLRGLRICFPFGGESGDEVEVGVDATGRRWQGMTSTTATATAAATVMRR